MVNNYTDAEIETMRSELSKRDAEILKQTDIFTLVYYGCSGYKTMHIEKIIKHYEAWKDKK
jgi:hypothetical protein|tara:strand:- start:387 stop:569 length:183 start_codon:yes stop_codon:yes gene_type:complete